MNLKPIVYHVVATYNDPIITYILMGKSKVGSIYLNKIYESNWYIGANPSNL